LMTRHRIDCSSKGAWWVLYINRRRRSWSYRCTWRAWWDKHTLL